MKLDGVRRPAVLFSVDALYEVRHIGAGPVSILCLELGGKQPASLVGVDALLLETESAGPQIDNEGLEDQFIAFGMSTAEPQQPRRHASSEFQL